jgi:hypothetical protein
MATPPLTRKPSRWSRFTQEAGNWLALLAFMVGLPVALIRFIGYPLPHHWPSVRQWENYADHPVSPDYIFRELACALWLIWAAMVIALLIQITCAITRIRLPRIRILAPFQYLSAVTAGAVGATITSMAANTTPPAAVSTFTVTATADHLAGASSPEHDDRRGPVIVLAETTTTQGTQPPLLCAGDHHLVIDGTRYLYTVARGQSLWVIAEACLGDGSLWPRIWELNQGRHFGVGGTLTDPDLIFPGWDLILPTEATPPAGAQPDPNQKADSDNTTTPDSEPSASTSNPGPSSPAPAPSVASPSVSTTSAPPQTDDRDGVINPSATTAPGVSNNGLPSTQSSSTVPTPAAAAPNDSRRRVGPGEGIPIPGGWITLALGSAICAAVALVWLQRRRDWVYRPETGDAEDDEGEPLRPMPPTVTRIRRGVRARAPELLPPDEPPPVTGEPLPRPE